MTVGRLALLSRDATATDILEDSCFILEEQKEKKSSDGEGFFLFTGGPWPHAAISDPGVAEFRGAQVHAGRADT